MSAMDRTSPVSSPTLSHRIIEQSDFSTIGRFSIADIFDSFIAVISAFFAGIFGVKSDESEKTVTGRVSPSIDSPVAKRTSEHVHSTKTRRLPVVDKMKTQGLTPPPSKKTNTGDAWKSTATHKLPDIE